MKSPRAWLEHIKQRKSEGVLDLNTLPHPHGNCERCDAVGELRPYGPKGEWICYDCGMKNKAETVRQIRRSFGVESH